MPIKLRLPNSDGGSVVQQDWTFDSDDTGAHAGEVLDIREDRHQSSNFRSRLDGDALTHGDGVDAGCNLISAIGVDHPD